MCQLASDVWPDWVVLDGPDGKPVRWDARSAAGDLACTPDETAFRAGAKACECEIPPRDELVQIMRAKAELGASAGSVLHCNFDLENFGGLADRDEGQVAVGDYGGAADVAVSSEDEAAMLAQGTVLHTKRTVAENRLRRASARRLGWLARISG